MHDLPPQYILKTPHNLPKSRAFNYGVWSRLQRLNCLQLQHSYFIMLLSSQQLTCTKEVGNRRCKPNLSTSHLTNSIKCSTQSFPQIFSVASLCVGFKASYSFDRLYIASKKKSLTLKKEGLQKETKTISVNRVQPPKSHFQVVTDSKVININ